MTYNFGTTNFADTQLDAFNRLRVSSPLTLFEGKFHYGLGIDGDGAWTQTTATGGTLTFLNNESAINLAVTTTSGSLARMRTQEYFAYHTGKGQLIMMTGVFGVAQANTVKRVGYFDDNDGLYFIQNGATGFGVAKRSSVSGSNVETIVYQSAWNLDPMDGTGPSGLTMNVANTEIYSIDFQWLGVGSATFTLGIDGQPYQVHRFDHSNKTTQVYMKSGSLPVTYEIFNTGTAASAAALKQICSAVMSEGAQDPIGESYATGDTTVTSCPTGAWTPIVTIRVPTTFNGQTVRGKDVVKSVHIMNTTGTQSGGWALIRNGTLTGAVYSNVANTVAFTQFDVASTAIANGTFKLQGYAAISSTSDVDAPNDILDVYPGDTLTLAGRGITGTCAMIGSINWREIK